MSGKTSLFLPSWKPTALWKTGLIALSGVIGGGVWTAARGDAEREVVALATRVQKESFLRAHIATFEDPHADPLKNLHPEAITAFPGKRLDRAGVAIAAKSWQGLFKDTKVRVERVMVEGNFFTVEYLYASTHTASGKREAVGTVATGELRDGKIYLWKEYLDGRVSRAQIKDELPVDEDAEPFPWPDTPESRVP
ncbi:MAG TPA: nuclear transport factor 2 family protein [Opitutaceae bacterium]|nr:nuclear transport factor 2 family protein [Opitutaceae bacterium]